MNYVDIAIIAIIALFALIGLWKGTGKTAIKLVCFCLAIVGTWFISQYLFTKVLSIGFVNDLVTGSGKVSLYQLYYNTLSEEVLNATKDTQLTGALGLLINPMIARFTAIGGPDAYNITYAQFIALNLSINTVSVVMCVVLYVVVRLVASLIAWILKKIFIHGEVHALSRFIGFVLGAVRGAAVVMVLLIISSVILPFGWATSYAETAGSGVIGKFACEYTYKAYDAVTFGTADNATKTKELLSVAGIEEVTLDKIKVDAIAELESYKVAKTDSAEYSEVGLANLDACVVNGKTAINAVENTDGVNTALSDAKANIDAVLNKAQEEELATAKTEKKTALATLLTDKLGEKTGDTYAREAEYTPENVTVIKSLYNEGYVAIDQGKTVAEVESIYSDYETKINAVKTTAEEALLTAKTTAVNTLINYVNAETAKHELSDDVKSKITEAQTDGTMAINNAIDTAGVETALTDAKAEIDSIISTATSSSGSTTTGDEGGATTGD